MVAARNGNAKIVQTLIDEGANLDAKDIYGETALMYAIGYRHTMIAKTLIDEGASVNEEDVAGMTALNIAMGQGNTEVAELLKEKGAEIDGTWPHYENFGLYDKF